MGKQHINIMQSFNAPIDTIFNILTDHEAFGQVINANIILKMVFQKKLRSPELPKFQKNN